MLFQILSCVERYLAVVHPLIYLVLKQVSGVRIRNIATAYIWLLCFGGLGFHFLLKEGSRFSYLPSTCQFAVNVISLTVSSVSVLRVLIRPRPEEGGGARRRVSQSQKKAYHTILVITGVLFLRFGGNLVCNLVGFSFNSDQCVVVLFALLVNVPSSLVLPLLVLHREGKLPGFNTTLNHISVCNQIVYETRLNYTSVCCNHY
ncbi:hypothetical protein KUCAC02_009688 [Chaenocephalus aceratus]|nr:hypothetical protein KUCAC02_009688 [Chaenocephalus aceratus]